MIRGVCEPKHPLGILRPRGFVLVRETDGRDNEERTPDALYEWAPG